ncbi:hypothetical protein ACH5RR_035355 [Cinchona calisaya]|uniref:Protein MULTIPLE CHLOROPLAST DIVISION SITE 1 n=1 Tax=Cinchona calisaya TaxID=153742 RepID=A0ABD2YDL9_9GENT
MASLWTLQLHAASLPRCYSSTHLEFRAEVGGFCSGFRKWNRNKFVDGKFVLRALSDPWNVDEEHKRIDDQNEVIIKANVARGVKSQNPLIKLQHTVASLPPVIFLKKKHFSISFAAGLCAVAMLLIVVLRSYLARKSRNSRPGSVADLVRRGQLRSDRRGISTPLKYEDPFNNPMVKVGKSNSTVEMCGKLYRLAPVTLTKEQQAIHQKRRSHAYQWKRPKVFLKEGDSVPSDVDPDTVRWIPANHPFATTASDIDEDLAQHNVYQKHGVPFRIQAEHEALQRKLESLQNEQKLGKLVIDHGAAKDFERPFKSHLKSEDQVEQSSSNSQMSPKHTNSDSAQNSYLNRPASDEMQKP